MTIVRTKEVLSLQPHLVFNGNFTYKNFDFSILIQGASGAYAYNGYKFTTTYPAHTSIAGANLSDFALDTWSPSNPNASNPRLSIDDPNQNIRMSDFWLESTDYVRIKNLSVGYSLKANSVYDALRIYATAQKPIHLDKLFWIRPLKLETEELTVANILFHVFSYPWI